jgi:hypothetical protein
MNSLKTAVHYRRDNHTNWDHNKPDVSASSIPGRPSSKTHGRWHWKTPSTPPTRSISLVGSATTGTSCCAPKNTTAPPRRSLNIRLAAAMP